MTPTRMDFDLYKQETEKATFYAERIKGFKGGYCALKLVGESFELQQDAIACGRVPPDRFKDMVESLIKEAGDVCWYVAALARELNIGLYWHPHPTTYTGGYYDHMANVARAVVANAAEIAEFVGKTYRDQDGKPEPDMKEAIRWRLETILNCIADLALQVGCSMEFVFAVNIDKLADRQRRGVLGGAGDNR